MKVPHLQTKPTSTGFVNKNSSPGQVQKFKKEIIEKLKNAIAKPETESLAKKAVEEVLQLVDELNSFSLSYLQRKDIASDVHLMVTHAACQVAKKNKGSIYINPFYIAQYIISKIHSDVGKAVIQTVHYNANDSSFKRFSDGVKQQRQEYTDFLKNGIKDTLQNFDQPHLRKKLLDLLKNAKVSLQTPQYIQVKQSIEKLIEDAVFKEGVGFNCFDVINCIKLANRNFADDLKSKLELFEEQYKSNRSKVPQRIFDQRLENTQTALTGRQYLISNL